MASRRLQTNVATKHTNQETELEPNQEGPAWLSPQHIQRPTEESNAGGFKQQIYPVSLSVL
jgi:hypothetical protein